MLKFGITGQYLWQIKTNEMMENETYLTLFQAFENAPMEEFLKVLLKGVPPGQQRRLVFEDLSFHQLSAALVTLEAYIQRNF